MSRKWPTKQPKWLKGQYAYQEHLMRTKPHKMLKKEFINGFMKEQKKQDE